MYCPARPEPVKSAYGVGYADLRLLTEPAQMGTLRDVYCPDALPWLCVPDCHRSTAFWNQIPKRAEQRQTDQLRDTFVDSGVAAVLQVVDHQALYGRRGTGKTHALRYLESELRARGDVAIYADLPRVVGSPESLFMGEAISATNEPPDYWWTCSGWCMKAC